MRLPRIIIIAIVILLASDSYADIRSTELINKVKQKLASSPAYQVLLSSDHIHGTLTVSGYKFALISKEAEIYYDGVTLWNYSIEKREVNIETLNPSDPNVMMNPSKLMDVSEKDFSHRSLAADILELTPLNNNTYYARIILTIDMNQNIPQKIEIVERETGDKMVVIVSAFKPITAVLKESFQFNPKNHKGIDIVDFR